MNNTQNSAQDGLHKSKLTDGEEENGRIKKKRFLYIDSLKGLCIILVVVYHCRLTVINDNINQMLLHIRVPMFFFLSGLFFKRYSGFNGFILKKFNQLIVPFFFFSYIPFCLLTYFYSDRYADPMFYLLAAVKPWNTPLWFLRALFFAYIFYYFIDKYTENMPKWLTASIILVLVSLAWILDINFNKLERNNPSFSDWSFIIIDLITAVKTMLYFFLAQQVNKRGWLDFKFNWVSTLLLSSVALIIAYFCRQAKIYSYSSDYFQHIILSYGCSFFSFAGLGILFAKFKYTKLLEYFGKNSLIVLGCHGVFIKILKVNFMMPSYMHFIITFILMFPCIYIFKKYFSYFTAQKELIKFKQKDS